MMDRNTRAVNRSTADMWRHALQRAKANRLVPYRDRDPDALGIWYVGEYVLCLPCTPHPLGGFTHEYDATTCTCPAGKMGRICKHKAAVVFAAKHGLRPIRPADQGLQDCYGTVAL